MRVTLIVAALVAMAVPRASGHICMWSPMQRSTFSINTPGDSDCYRKVGPCGENTPGSPKTKLVAGQPYDVHFQQNLNHYYTNKPGQLALDFAPMANPTEADFKPLVAPFADYNAMNEITQTNFTRTITVPSGTCDSCVIRARYLSNNPDENDRGTIFYQCADVSIVAFDEARHQAAAPAKTVEQPASTPSYTCTSKAAGSDGDSSCCAPKSFTTQFTGSNDMRHGMIYYDANAQMMRIDVTSGSGTKGVTSDGIFQMYSNFSSGIEWYYNKVTGECLEYGLDFWNEWCFGTAAESEKFECTATCPGASGSPGTACNVFSNGDWRFGATTGTCFPAMIAGTSQANAPNVTYFGAKEGAISPDTFVAPATCKPHHASTGTAEREAAPSHLPGVAETSMLRKTHA